MRGLGKSSGINRKCFWGVGLAKPPKGHEGPNDTPITEIGEKMAKEEGLMTGLTRNWGKAILARRQSQWKQRAKQEDFEARMEGLKDQGDAIYERKWPVLTKKSVSM